MPNDKVFESNSGGGGGAQWNSTVDLQENQM